MSRVIDWRRRPFWTNVVMTDTCWLYVGSKKESGYGDLTPMQRERTGERRAHRHAYVLFNGPIPAGLQINHHCDVPACVRPDHLYAGTPADNMRDRSERGRCNPKKTVYCPQGHIRTEYGGRLICVECRREASLRYHRRKRQVSPERYRK